MKRNLSVERLFPLGDFKNIKFTSELKDIPEEIALNEDAVKALWLMMAFNTDMAYLRYYEVLERTAGKAIKEKLVELEKVRSAAEAELRSNINLSEKKYAETVEQAKKVVPTISELEEKETE